MQFEHVTCPHCGLLCDDLSAEVTGLTVTLKNTNHPHCTAAYSDASFADEELFSPRIKGNNATLEDAVNQAASILKTSSQPLVGGLIADIQACRNAVALAEKTGGVVDHINSPGIRSGTSVMQRIGEVRTTLAEVRNRADCVLILGNGILKKFPRLVERVLTPKKTLGSKHSVNKKIYILDIPSSEICNIEKDVPNVIHMQLQFNLLESLIYRLQEVFTNKDELLTNIDSTTKALIDLRETIKQSQYTTFIWSNTEFQSPSAEQTTQALTETIKVLMESVRCVGLPLGGSKGEVTANQVATWQTGVPLPVAFMQGIPVCNPALYDGNTMIKNNEIDSLLWVATYSSDDTPPHTSAKTIVIGHPKMKCDDAEVFIPCGIPGIDSRGLACRTDNVATLPLHKIRDSSLPAASDVLQQILDIL